MPPGRAIAALTRVVAAVSLFSLEMQAATWLGGGTMRSLLLLNVSAAAVSFLRTRPARTARGAKSIPIAAAASALALLVLALNLSLPLTAADPYHLQRVAQIERIGTLAYDLAVDDPKVNVLGWPYELVLADIRQIPLAGDTLVRVHGLLGLGLYLLTLAAVRTWFGGGRPWTAAALLVVPVLFHQLVLVKNDLFGAMPALVVLAWLAARGRDAPLREVGWAAWLAGFAVAVKATSAPVAAVLVGTLLLERRERSRLVALLLAGGLVGAVCGGLAFTLVENARWYGDPMAVHEAGAPYNRNQTVAQAATGIVRFAISLFDLGLITRSVWPGRGGWGSTFGLPFIWALVMLGLRYRRAAEARRGLGMAAAYFLLFAAVYTDADLAHRMALAPGVLLIAVAVSLTDGDDGTSRRMRAALAVVVALSAAQILRSAALYLSAST